ncbi:PE-PPE domain-containing protein [Mycobacterium sp. NPDC051804]|uniref:PE-PPE domain-containing protein n=1 Tax=Mycobacterium sp. NPDC051804 TaxID=3364295 RepID=UPI0037A200E8
MRGTIRSLGVVGLALLSVVGLAVAWTAATVVQLTATALIMGGTDHPLTATGDDPVYVNRYLNNVVNFYINPAASPTRPGENPTDGVDGDPVYAVTYPAQFFPVYGSQTFDSSVRDGRGNLSSCVRGTGCEFNGRPPAGEPPLPGTDNAFVVFGYSQSAVVASLVKKDLIETRPANTDVSFFLLANPMRPNGGVLARGPEGLTIPILGITFYGATPTNSCNAAGECYETVDVAAQYDGLGGDAPASLTNVLAIANAVLGYYYFHGDLQDGKFQDAKYQGSTGDTDYYIVPAKRLPILMPFESFVPSPILTLLEAPLKAAIEAGYARDVDPGVATKVGLLPFRDPVQAVVNIIKAIPVGIDDAIAEASGDVNNRPLGTDPVTSPFGVGGPELPDPPSAYNNASMLFSSRVGQDSAAHDGEISDDTIPQDGTIEENLGENIGQENAGGDVRQEGVVEEEVIEEVPEGGVTQKLESTTPRVGLKPVTRFGERIRSTLDSIRLPKIRGPIRFDSQRDAKPPAATKPGESGTTTGEQDPDPAAPARDPGSEAPAA